jgi:hypothetical protein
MQVARRRHTLSWGIAVIALASLIYGATLQLTSTAATIATQKM